MSLKYNRTVVANNEMKEEFTKQVKVQEEL
jgi:hypothetical protein